MCFVVMSFVLLCCCFLVSFFYIDEIKQKIKITWEFPTLKKLCATKLYENTTTIEQKQNFKIFENCGNSDVAEFLTCAFSDFGL